MSELWLNFASDVVVTVVVAIASWFLGRWQGKIPIGRNMKMSPDQSQIVSEINGDLYLTDTTGKTTNLTRSHNWERNALWANKQNWLAFQRGEGTWWEIGVISVTSGKMITLASFPNSRPYHWDDSDNLIINLGGSDWAIRNGEIGRKLA